MHIRKGRFSDYRGGGWYISFIAKSARHLLFALRHPFRVAYVRPDALPHYRRLYLGWIEIQYGGLIERTPTVTHPDGKVFYRNSADQWMPL